MKLFLLSWVGLGFLLLGFTLSSEYDYIVVGSGIGGGTLAVELAQKGHSVLLIEAGPDYQSEIISIPLMHVNASEEKHITFDFKVKYFNEGHASDKVFHYPRVGGLGGCSTHNVMVSVLPNSRDYNLMADVTGDNGWKEKSMRNNYFKRMERNQYSIPLLNSAHGYDGWFPISYANHLRTKLDDPKLLLLLPSILSNPFKDINGYDILGNLNTDKEGRVLVPMAVDNFNYERVDFKGHIRNTQKNFNLEVWTDTFVTKVLLDKENIATGVAYTKGKYLYKASPLSQETKYTNLETGQVFAKREIIVAGGAFNTPQILMLSGIGDSKHLKEMGIEPKVHLPGVGQNLMDKHESSVVYQLDEDLTLTKRCKYMLDKTDPCYLDYKEHKVGPYIFNGIISGELIKTREEYAEPDVFVVNIPARFNGYDPGFAEKILGPRNLFSQVIFKVHTRNKGYVKLRSNNPFDTPEINFNKFSDGIGPNSEMADIVKAVKTSREFMETLWVKGKTIYPNQNVTTDAQLRDYIRENIFGHHICCTAKVGKDDDPQAVLDNRFRVRNTSNLRVVDAAAFPAPPGYYPAVFTHMFAMKVADLIHEDSKL